jgi:ferredoxin
MMEHRIVFLSPAGTTAQIAQKIGQCLESLQQNVVITDLKQSHPQQRWSDNCCLWIGTPVYCDHALPIIETFIANLPKSSNSFSVPFATWGGVTSGTTLLEMATALKQQGWPSVAAAKFLAVHSCMWQCEHPLGLGHPGNDELTLIHKLTTQVVTRLQQATPELLPTARLDYLSDHLKQDAATKSLAKAKASSPPPQADPALCTGCGTCISQCPMHAMTLETTPQISDACIRCLQCIRFCPQQAFPFDPKAYETRIRHMQSCSDEEPKSELFV